MSKTALEKYKELKEKRKQKKKAVRKKKAKIDRAKIREKKKEETHKRQLKKKRDAYKPIHLKNQRRRQNQRAYKKLKEARLKEHSDKGDVRGFYRIILAKNHAMTKELTHSFWMLTAYEKYNNYIKENRDGVICEKRVVYSCKQTDEPVKYEILLIKRVDPKTDSVVRELRNEDGMFVENRISNRRNYAIIAKDNWYIPETYNVYGYNPITDRKTGRWIYDNMLIKDCSRENSKNVFMCDNKLIIQTGLNYEFIFCKNSDECIRLYNGFQHEANGNKYILFSNFIASSRKSWLYDIIQEKTGWNRNAITKTTS